METGWIRPQNTPTPRLKKSYDLIEYNHKCFAYYGRSGKGGDRLMASRKVTMAKHKVLSRSKKKQEMMSQNLNETLCQLNTTSADRSAMRQAEI